MLNQIKKELQKHADPKQAAIHQRFFKTEKGGYGEGDIFLGIKVGPQRDIAEKYGRIGLLELQKLLSNRIHEHRLVALLILVDKYEHADDKEKKKIIDFYLKNTKYVNNWDLVDLSAPNLLGKFLLNNNRKIIYKLAKSSFLWERRIAIVSTYYLIKNNQFQDTLDIAEILLNDKHDLIHKAVGWMLREVGKKDQTAEENFLKKHYKTMPRTMLRYSIERFSRKKKEFYMKK